MMKFIFAIYMAVTARQAGGGLGAKYLPSYLPELLFAAGFGFAAYFYGGYVGSAVATAWSYIWMRTGHGVVLPWGRPIKDGTFKDEMLAGRVQTLTPAVDAIANRLNISTKRSATDGSYEVNYCRLFMAVKGFLIGLPCGGVILAVLWPVAYEIGARVGRNEVSELLSGLFAAANILLFILAAGV